MKERRERRVKKPFNITAIILFVFLCVYVLSLLALYLWAFGVSLKTNRQFIEDPIGFPTGWPWQWAWDNYPTAISKIRVFVTQVDRGYVGYVYFGEMLFNSILYTIGGTLVNNVTIWVMAYMIARFNRYKISKLLFAANIALMTIPVIGNLPSALAVFSALGWYNNYSFIVFNNIGFTGVYLLYFCAFIRGLGNEYYEAAYIDGAGNLTCMLKIAFPLTAQMFAVLFLLGAITRWNDYMTMLIWMPDYPTIAYGIYKTSVVNTSEMSYPPLQISVCLVLMLPLLVLFLLFQKPIMGNLRLGALKG